MDNTPTKPKGRKKVMIYRGIAIFFLIIEILGLLGSSASNRPDNAGAGANIGYYIGYNFPLLLAILFFYLSYKASKLTQKTSAAEQLNSIGSNH